MELQPTEAVSRCLRRVKRRDNLFEKSIRSRLYARGVRYRLDFPLRQLKRISCDLAMPGQKIAVFLDRACSFKAPTAGNPPFRHVADCQISGRVFRAHE